MQPELFSTYVDKATSFQEVNRMNVQVDDTILYLQKFVALAQIPNGPTVKTTAFLAYSPVTNTIYYYKEG